jgi:hypothetical protein
MYRSLTISVVLLLGTSCPRKSVVLHVEPQTGTVLAEDHHAATLALLERIVRRHAFASSVSLNGAHCTKTWRRPVSGGARLGPWPGDAIICAEYALTGPIVVQVYDDVPTNRQWTPATDSLRRELVDSLSRWGSLKIGDRAT